jgi:hypothetical protein
MGLLVMGKGEDWGMAGSTGGYDFCFAESVICELVK